MSDTIRIYPFGIGGQEKPELIDTREISQQAVSIILEARFRLREMFGERDLSHSINAFTEYETNTAIDGAESPKGKFIIQDQVFLAYREAAIMVNILNPEKPDDIRLLGEIRTRLPKGLKTHLGDGNFATFSVL